MKRYFLLAAVLLVSGAWSSSCNSAGASGQEANAVNRQQDLYTRNQPAPTFDFSLDRYLMIELYKARNTAVATYSYVQSEYTGKILWSCPSIGFPIPAATQLTNPEEDEYWNTASSVHITIPQAEPNGLYSPATADGTYVMCLDTDGQVAPRYEERHVFATLQPMQEVGGSLVPVSGKGASFHIPLPAHR